MAVEAMSGCFDSSSVAMRSLGLAQHDIGRESILAAINGRSFTKKQGVFA